MAGKSNSPDWDKESLQTLTASRSAITDDAQPEEFAKDTDEKIEKNRKDFFVHLTVIVVVVVSLVGLWGAFSRRNFNFFTLIRLKPDPLLQPLESCDNSVLILESMGDKHTVLVQQSPQDSWLRPSQADNAAPLPALSPEADWVAYIALGDVPTLTLVALEGKPQRIALSYAEVQAVGTAKGFKDISFCEWTPLVWDVDGQRVAFFACGEKTSESRVFVATISSGTITAVLVPNSKLESNVERQIHWAGPNALFISFPGQTGPTFKTIDIQ